MHQLELFMVVAAVLLFAGVLASKISAYYGVPSLALFLAIGMLAGSDGPGGIWFDNAEIAQALGTVALAFILQGTTIPLAARTLRLQAKSSVRRRSPLEFLPDTHSNSDLVEVVLSDQSPVVDRQIVDVAWPKSALAVLISRAGKVEAVRSLGGAVAKEAGRSNES